MTSFAEWRNEKYKKDETGAVKDSSVSFSDWKSAKYASSAESTQPYKTEDSTALKLQTEGREQAADLRRVEPLAEKYGFTPEYVLQKEQEREAREPVVIPEPSVDSLRSDADTLSAEHDRLVELRRIASNEAEGLRAGGADTTEADARVSELDKQIESVRGASQRTAEELADKPTRADELRRGVGYVAERAVGGAADTVQGIVNYIGMLGQGMARSTMQSDEFLSTAIPLQEKTGYDLTGAAERLTSGEFAPVTEFATEYRQDVENRYEGVSDTARTVGDVAAGVGGMAPAVLSNFLLPGSSLYVVAAGAAGNAATEAKSEGVSDERALLYGTSVGILEAASEKLFDGVAQIFGKGAADDVIERAVRSAVKNETAQNALLKVAGALGEGTEEFITELGGRIVNEIMVDTDDRSFLETLGDGAYSFLVGSLVSGVTQAANAGITGAKQTAAVVADKVKSDIKAARPETAEETLLRVGEELNAPQETVTADGEELLLEAAGLVEPAAVVGTEQGARQSLDERKAAFNTRAQAWQEALERARAEGYTDEQYDALLSERRAIAEEQAAIEQAQRVDAGAVSRDFGEVSNHIDNRTNSSVAARNVKAFQFDHPELHRFYVDAARALIADAEVALGSEQHSYGLGTTYVSSEAINRAVSLGLSRNAIIKVCEDIIANNGQENYADAKRVELILDDMLSRGYTPASERGEYGAGIGPNAEYVAAKERIVGAVPSDSFERYLEDNRLPLELGETTEEELRREWEARGNDGLGAANAGFAGDFAAWQMATEGSGFHPVNEQAQAVTADDRGRAAIEVPKKNLEGRLTSKMASTLLNANITTNDFAETLERELASGKFSRMAYTDDAATRAAGAHIRNVGYEQAKNEWLVEAKAGKMSKDMTARGVALYNAAVNAGDAIDALDIASAMIDYGKSLGQSLQAMNLINKLDPSAQLYGIAKSAEKIAEELRERFAKEDIDITLDPALVQEFLDAETDEARNEAKKVLYQNIADQIPASWADKFNAWRYLMMLGNPRTHVRNILGNLGFWPVRVIKNALATGIEAATLRGGRTKAVLNPLSADDRALLQAAWSEYGAVYNTVSASSKYDEARNEIMEMRTIYKFKPLEAVRKFASNSLSAEDQWFSQPAYTTSLAGYLKANGVTAEEYLSEDFDEQTRARAQEYAIKEAQKATYQDTNALSDFVAGLQYRGDNPVGKAVNVLAEGTLPFRRTPANIIVRGVAEYSPVGVLRGVKQLATDVKSGNKTAAEAIDLLASGLTGSALLGLGAYLAHAGLVSGGASGDDKQDEWNKLGGEQQYALRVGDRTVTLDWLAPEALPFFVGVEAYNSLSDRDKFSFSDVLDALTGISEPMLELSMLSSLNDLIDSVGYTDNPTWSVLANMATSYLTQFVPTLGGQIERAFTEDTRQSTFVDRDSQLPGDVQYLLAQTLNKIPGVEYNQIDYVDAWGRTESTGGLGERALNNFLNPAYVSELDGAPFGDELQRLYDAGYTSVFPTRAAQSTQVDGEYLTAEEYVLYQQTMGSEVYRLYEDLLGSDSYAALSDKGRADAISDIKSLATDAAKAAVVERRGEEYESDTVADVSDPESYLALKAGLGNEIRSKTPDYEALDRYLTALDDAPDDVANMLLDTVDGLGKISAFVDSGMTAQEADQLYDDLRALEPLEGYSQVTDQQRRELIINRSGISDKEKTGAVKQYLSENQSKKLDAVLDSGASLKDWLTAKQEFDRIDKDTKLSTNEKATKFAQWVDNHYSGSEASALKAAHTYSSGFTVAPDTYTKFTAAGLEPDDAAGLFDALGALEPVGDNKTVSDQQQYEVITNYPGLSDKEILDALDQYITESSESTYQKYLSAYQVGISPADFTEQRGYINGLKADKDSKGNSISGSKKKKVLEYINGLDLTTEQKDWWYLDIMDYSKNELKYAPWH